MGTEPKISSAAQKIARLVGEFSDGVDLRTLTVAAVRRYRTLPERRVPALVEEARTGGLLVVANGRVALADQAAESKEPASAAPAPEVATPRVVLRAVVVDLESVVRTVATTPYAERHVFEVAAQRLGADQEWVTSAPAWQRYLRFPGDIDELRDEHVRGAVRDHGVLAADAWMDLGTYLSDADVVIAYNGTGLDFDVIRQSAQDLGIDDPLGGRRLVDALYLTHALWPTATTHRLHDLAGELGVSVAGARAHTASGDVALLAALLQRAAAELADRGADLAGLIADVCPDSDRWRLLRELHQGPQAAEREPLAWEQADVARLLGEELAWHTPRRTPDLRAPGRRPVVVPDGLRGAEGRVDPTELARVVRGAQVRPRPAQQEMAATLHAWTDQGVGGLLEAPTGTGKSYAVLAAALDWLAGGADRTAVIATYTKQLQGQLARDLDDLQRALPGLLDFTDMVKGQANRLSLAALTKVLADATRGGTGRPRIGRGTHRRSTRPVENPRYRELAVYLVLRLIAATAPPLSWTARSVDPVDLPPFFADYVGRALPTWLESFSQRDGDYAPGAGNPLARHTDTAREALDGHRLIVANHALALSHLDDLRALGPQTLLVVDEAHELENAATSALTTVVDYQDLETLSAEYQVLSGECRPGTAADNLAATVAELEGVLDDTRLPRMAAEAFDAHGKGVGVRVGSRTTTLASPHTGSAGSRGVRRLQRLLTGIARAAARCRIDAERYAAQEQAFSLDPQARDRVTALSQRTDTLVSALDRITTDLDAFLDPAADLDEKLPSRVVHMEELGEPEVDLRAYRFRIATSPVDLPADPEWRRFLDSFQRVHYVSATLRVGGAWDFVRERLGLPADLPELALPSPFDLARQAELVCFSDFPSWAEQEEGAMRTVAHHLAGFAQEMTHPDENGNGYTGGGMVLTTARSTAAGIGAHLVEQLRARTLEAPVVEAMTLGNGRAYQTFTDPEHGGGFLVGTRGLWQGVDVADAERLRLVWINKLPFAPFAAPIIAARRASVRETAERAGHPDPDGFATQHYYLPLAAIQLRQAVGRLIRSDRHRGVVIISDRKLAGDSALRRSYRRAFLGSLDEGLERPGPEEGDTGGDNVATMAEGWRRIWTFFAREGLLDPSRAAELCTPQALAAQTLLPQTRQIRELELSEEEVQRLRTGGRLVEEVLERCARIGGLLRLSDEPVELKAGQRAVITAAADGQNVLGLLPTGFGKSYTFQLPALVLPGVTLVVSPLVALMHDQALELNRTIGGAVRALISPLRESSSRAGKTEVADQLLGRHDHGIRLVYVSPERLSQRRFRELVRQAAASGRISRIAVDEAHTLAQWEDFRPSMRRVSRFLAELRRDHGIAVTAVTATANRTVHQALREALFGLTGEIPEPGTPQEKDEAEQTSTLGGLVTVRENPIRPELAVLRRSLDRFGQGGIAGLVEHVVDSLDGHAILYCLTVKEVNTLYTHLREYTGGTGVRVLRFHGRLTEAEKAAVMTEFREAPRQGDEAFVPVVTVATSAFGLGVNRPDIRTVFCVSPPTDLAALYQQIGRAGRDSAGRSTTAEGPVNAGLALATSRGLRMVRFMTGQELPQPLMRRMGSLILSQNGSSFDPLQLAELLMEQDLAEGVLTEQALDDRHEQERYRSGVMRAFSVLADLGAVSDLGDYPPYCAVKPGDMKRTLPSHGSTHDGEAAAPDSGAEVDDIERLVVETALALDTPARLDVGRLDRELARLHPEYRDVADGPAATWELLADLHDRGLLDVSAAPSRHLVTGIDIRTRKLPDDYLRLLTRRSARAAEELSLLRSFFEKTDVCAQRLFADYFGVTELPEGCCTSARCRCSACWNSGRWPASEHRPAVAHAFDSPRPRENNSTDSTLRRQRVDRQAHRLLMLQPEGLHPRRLWSALRGDESAFNPSSRRMIRLPGALTESRHFGGRADLPYAEVENSLERLAHIGAVVETEKGRWRAVRASGPGRTTGIGGRNE